MIAVFCRYTADFDRLRLSPAKLFVHIKSVDDIKGRTFTGLIAADDFYLGSDELVVAYETLIERQPELFKTKSN